MRNKTKDKHGPQPKPYSPNDIGIMMEISFNQYKQTHFTNKV